MSDDDPLETLRAAREALQASLRAAIRQADMDDPDALEQLLQAQRQVEDTDNRIAVEVAKRPPVQGPKQPRRSQLP